MGQNILADLEKMGIQLQTENEQVVYSEGLASKSILKISNGKIPKASLFLQNLNIL